MEMNAMKANAAALANGDWVSGLDGFGDFRVKIKPFDCPEADKYQQDLLKVILGRGATRRGKAIPPGVRDYVYAKSLIEVCVVDWDNWHENGEKVPYSKTKLEEFLLMDAPSGVKVGKNMVMTPDGKAYNYEGKFLYEALLDKAQAVSAPDDDEDESGVDENESGELSDPEKNASSAGSGDDSASAPT